MVGRAKKLAGDLARKIKRDTASVKNSDTFALGIIVSHFKRNWVDVKTKTLKISWLNSQNLE